MLELLTPDGEMLGAARSISRNTVGTLCLHLITMHDTIPDTPL